ncbi:TRAP transporter small permease [Thermacetogenium phaeum]|jgi:TRAP-type C4-dicarboxylate transport system permease small subunit|uniref:TRAP transporter small permease n=1 Tax=Thermacetogenium phaeum TaxID=85874 RepID=UPI00048F8158|nr:TRAP transporter small permease [Thermacetogenium phaeum]
MAIYFKGAKKSVVQLRKHLRRILTCLDSISGVLLLVCTASAFINVVARYVFSRPFVWGEEVSVLALVWMVYLSQGLLENDNEQLAMTALYRALGEKVRRAVDVLRCAVTVFLSGYLLYAGMVIVMRNGELNMTTQAIGFPLWIAYLVIPLALACMIMARLVHPITDAPAAEVVGMKEDEGTCSGV